MLCTVLEGVLEKSHCVWFWKAHLLAGGRAENEESCAVAPFFSIPQSFPPAYLGFSLQLLLCWFNYETLHLIDWYCQLLCPISASSSPYLQAHGFGPCCFHDPRHNLFLSQASFSFFFNNEKTSWIQLFIMLYRLREEWDITKMEEYLLSQHILIVFHI